ncbi:MAG: hypothetical protein HYU97_05930 [Deltaproteobacteria bacterium]|nr:hypothetical protein [Deltaproteobacteria bacterium]
MSLEILDVFAITPEDQDRPWAKIGVAFINRDQSINVLLDALPFTGKIHIRKRKPRQAAAPAKEAVS